MKNKLLAFVFVFVNAAKLFATNSLNATYSSERVRINQFLCYYENLPTEHLAYSEMEEKFNLFCYFADSLLAMSRRLCEKISFYSENGIAQMDIGEKTFLFVSGKRESEVRKSADAYILSENYNDPLYIIPSVCKELKLKLPRAKHKDKKLYSLETKFAVDFAFEEEENNSFFFLPGGECHFEPNFELQGNHYIGFYYSEGEAKVMKKILKDKHKIDAEIKAFPRDFRLINEAYFKIEKR